MLKIRKGVFETNSSSMHSFSLEKVFSGFKRGFKEFKPLMNGTLVIDIDYYGRYPFKLLNTPEDKVRYLLADIFEYGHKKEINKMLSTKNYTKEVQDILDILHKYIDFKVLKVEEIDWAIGVDHASLDIFDIIKARNIDMEEFIFNPNYVIIVDGDEYDNCEIYYNFDAKRDNTGKFYPEGTLTEKGVGLLKNV